MWGWVVINDNTSTDEFRICFRYLFVFLGNLFPTPTASCDRHIKGLELADTLSSFCYSIVDLQLLAQPGADCCCECEYCRYDARNSPALNSLSDQWALCRSDASDEG